MKSVLALIFIFQLSMAFGDNAPRESLPDLHKAVMSGNLDRVKSLIRAGADVNQLDDKMGNSPLHIAAQTDHTQILEFLIVAGAFVNLQAPKSGMSPLMIATWYSKPKNVQALLSAPDINVNLKTPQGLMAEEWISGFDQNLDENEKKLRDQLKKIYKDFRAKLNSEISNQKLIAIVLDPGLAEEVKLKKMEPLLKDYLNVNERQPVIGNGNDFHSALLIAARQNYPSIVKLLLTGGADQSLPGYMMNAIALHKAAYFGNVEVLKVLLEDPNVKKIINDEGPNNGYTPLHDAIWHGHLEAAKVLIDAGARLDLQNYEGDTPLDLALRYKYSEIAKYIESKF